jgi:hypothetical protein
MEDPTANLSHEEALNHWGMKSNPWKIGNKILRRPKLLVEINPALVYVSEVGNVLSMPPVVGMPCFGLPMPHLRFIDLKILSPTTNALFKHRCGNCPVNAACAKVVGARTSWEPTLKQRTKEYVSAVRHLVAVKIANSRAERSGQPRSRHQDRYTAARSNEKAANTRLRAELVKYVWVSSNDHVAAALSAKGEAGAALANARKARKARKRQLRDGTIPQEYHLALKSAADERAKVLADYAGRPDADTAVKKMDIVGFARDAAVWAEAVRMRWAGKKPAAYSIASRLYPNEPEKLESRRSSVDRALKRIARYESSMAGCGGRLWEEFEPEDWL